MVNFDCQLNRIENHHDSKPLGVSTKSSQIGLIKVGKLSLNVDCTVGWDTGEPPALFALCLLMGMQSNRLPLALAALTSLL